MARALYCWMRSMLLAAWLLACASAGGETGAAGSAGKVASSAGTGHREGTGGKAGANEGYGGLAGDVGIAGSVAGHAGEAAEGAAGEAATEFCDLTYRQGHGDLFVRFSGQLELAIRSTFGAAPPEVLAEPSRVCVVVPEASRALTQAMGGAPESPSFAFLGVPAGELFWLLPASPREGMPWFGASTEDVPSAWFDDDEVRIVITAAEMPAGGEVAAWSTNTFGEPTALFSTAMGSLSHAFPSGAHLHFNWAFSVAGHYRLTLRIEGERDGAIESGPAASLKFLVQR